MSLSSLTRLVEIGVTLAGANTVAHKVKRSVHETIIKVAAGAISMAGVGFLLSALWIWLASLYGALFASLWIGLALVVVGGFTAVIGLMVIRQPVKPAVPAPDVTTMATELIEQFDFNFSRKGTPAKSLGAAVAAGFALGRVVSRA